MARTNPNRPTPSSEHAAPTTRAAVTPTRPAPVTAPAREPEPTADTAGGNRPVHRIRLGFCQAAIWENEGEFGVRHSVTLERLYTDDEGNWQHTRTFNASDLPNLAALLHLVIADIHHRRTEPWDGE